MYIYNITYERKKKIVNKVVRREELDSLIKKCRKKDYHIISIMHA